MKTKILVIIISFIFLFTYNIQSFATTEIVDKEIENKAKNEETDELIEEYITDNKEVVEFKEETYVANEQTEKDLMNKNSEITEENKIINLYNNIGIANYSGMINIDAPGNNQTFNTRKNGITINICGWAVANTPNAKLQCFVDDVFINSNIERVIRNDVNELIAPNFGGVSINSKSGFNCNVNLSLIKTGTHIFKIKQFSEDNKLISESQISLKIENQPYIRKYIY